MSTTLLHGIAALATSSSAPPARADCAMRDDARTVHGKLGIVGRDADRDEPDVAGHRVTELRASEAAA